ncbi:MAG: DegV family protein, partial [Thermoleophilaceae bacterium]
DFLEVYEPILAAGDDIVSIHLSGSISGTVNSAEQARDQLFEQGVDRSRIEVVDSKTTAAGLGFVVLGACNAATGGRDVAGVAQVARSVRAAAKMWFAVDTLEFLRRGGRIGAASAWIGSTLKVKPILKVERTMLPVERVRTNARMFERLVEYARERHASGADGWTVQHCSVPDQAQRLVGRCAEIFGSEPAFVSELGPVMSVHAGPGMLGLAALPARFLE